MRAVALMEVFVLAGCAGPAERTAQPNALQRAKVLSQNAAGIVVEHSEWGKPIALGLRTTTARA